MPNREIMTREGEDQPYNEYSIPFMKNYDKDLQDN